MAAVASETFTATSAPIQYAAVRAFQGGEELERYLMQSRRVLRSLSSWIWQSLSNAGLDVARPDGAFYMFPDFEPLRQRLESRGIQNSEQLCQRLLEETGVAILPGSHFGRPEQELTIRLAFVDFDGARALSAAAHAASRPASGACRDATIMLQRMPHNAAGTRIVHRLTETEARISNLGLTLRGRPVPGPCAPPPSSSWRMAAASMVSRSGPWARASARWCSTPR